MRRPVRIISRPKAQSGLDIKMNPGMGFNANQLSWPVMAGEFSQKDVETRGTIQPADWDNANLEAEKGETVVTDLNHDGIPEHYKIGGKRHYEGGTPLNLPSDSFIFSRDRGMKIKDEDIQKMFGKSPKRSGYTPADLAKQYDINKYRKILADSDSDDLQKETAEMMIANYNLKLGKLALAQESLKGFPQGIPAISMPYLENMGMNPAEFIQTQGQEEETAPDNMAKYGKEVKRKVRILGIPKAQQGVTVTKKQNIPEEAFTEGRVIKRNDYTSEQDYITARNEAYEKNRSKGIYTQGADGKYYIVKSSPIKRYSPSSIKLLQERFSDPEVAATFKEKILNAYDTKGNVTDAVKKVLSKKDIEEMTPEQLVGQFMEFNDRNIKTGVIIGESYDCFDNAKGKKLNTAKCKNLPYNSLEEVFLKVGAPLPDDKGKALQQLTYIGYNDLIDDRKKNKLNRNLQQKLQPFDIGQIGVSDETIAKGKGKISKADAAYTNTSAGQIADIIGDEYDEELVKEIDLSNEKKAQADIKNYQGPTKAPWWLQDIIGVAGAAGDYARVKKYMPWQATPQTYLVDGVFYDPNRSLAANAEQANIVAQNLAAFQGPQALSSRSSQIQGQAARQAADTMGRYDTMNVGVANQISAQNAQILNQAAQQRAALATTLFDKNTIANQQFDNAKNMAREALRREYKNAITNKWNTFNMNQLFPQYQVHPEIGGGIFFEDGRPVKPEKGSSTNALKTFKEYQDALQGVDASTVWNIAKADMGIDNSSIDPNYLAMLQAQRAGKLE